jgi:hypothetical protein
MPQFVILEHRHQGLHYDLMLEKDGVLLTWQFEQPPAGNPPRNCRRLPDHRLMYLNYEGPVSGNRGDVKVWDKGVLDLLSCSEKELHFKLRGNIIKGIFILTCEAGPETWLFALTANPVPDDFPHRGES